MFSSARTYVASEERTRVGWLSSHRRSPAPFVAMAAKLLEIIGTVGLWSLLRIGTGSFSERFRRIEVSDANFVVLCKHLPGRLHIFGVLLSSFGSRHLKHSHGRTKPYEPTRAHAGEPLFFVFVPRSYCVHFFVLLEGFS